jgi:hypothetical protein
MKVAYIFATSGHTVSYQLGTMILPQLEEGRYGVEVVGMMFFDDSTYILRKGDPVGERVGKIGRENGMLLMLCDQCSSERGSPSATKRAATPRATSSKAWASAAPRSPCCPHRQPARPRHHALAGVLSRFSNQWCAYGSSLKASTSA